jgi:hypothetical protein
MPGAAGLFVDSGGPQLPAGGAYHVGMQRRCHRAFVVNGCDGVRREDLRPHTGNAAVPA